MIYTLNDSIQQPVVISYQSEEDKIIIYINVYIYIYIICLQERRSIL